ncbi:bifunctional diaminohydroxyphosphoribosylaminopyrimidine deaminase/5-amino-6-(5-phosphoribosylamino)uracil reductase RibD [Ekhidna sp. To15]|uniref:bifunctional diaminohydroxyphosphoribosylaminopyrimidine deaminase/5-amino-6-(5-phosphoribosylamino)uracil reductase RibD n=1 Tax=Ekhidna sp. To15 TaxID=3395267 RepID=UPI003F51C231
MDDSLYMKRALELAALGRGHVSPNPMVGCVIVHQDKIVGEGYHQKYGEAHAEVNAIKDVKDQSILPACTAYVTLEPCAHHGKTPPCADLLIEKKLKRVVIACRDPFDQVDGKGMEKLKNAGIEVSLGVLQDEAEHLNRRFFTSIKNQRPYVILKWAQTLDGFVARENYDSKWISNSSSRQLVHKWRTEEDAILVGKNTAHYDNPTLTAREWSGRNPTRILLDSNLEIKKTSNLFNEDAPTLVLNSLKEEKKKNIEWIKTEMNNPWSVLRKLHEQNIQSVIIEGGSQVLNSFINENCWDEARVFITDEAFLSGIPAPKIEGIASEEEVIFNDKLITYRNNHG